MFDRRQSSSEVSVRGNWLRFSLRSLLVFITIIGPGMGWVAKERLQSQYEVQVVQQLGFRSTQLDGPYDVVFPAGSASQGWWRDAAEQLLGQRISTISGLGRVPMTLELTAVSGLTAVSRLTNLQVLDLSGEHISNLGSLAGATSLRCLLLSRAQVTDLTPLSGLTQLIELDLGYTDVSELSPLVNLANLRVLHLNDTLVSDLTPLTGLVKLECLTLNNTQVANLRPLASLRQLQELYVNTAPVTKDEIEWLKMQLPRCKIHQ